MWIRVREICLARHPPKKQRNLNKDLQQTSPHPSKQTCMYQLKYLCLKQEQKQRHLCEGFVADS